VEWLTRAEKQPSGQPAGGEQQAVSALAIPDSGLTVHLVRATA